MLLHELSCSFGEFPVPPRGALPLQVAVLHSEWPVRVPVYGISAQQPYELLSKFHISYYQNSLHGNYTYRDKRVQIQGLRRRSGVTVPS